MKKAKNDRIFNEIQSWKEKEAKESEAEKTRQMDDGLGKKFTEESNRRREGGSGVQFGDENVADLRNGSRGRSRIPVSKEKWETLEGTFKLSDMPDRVVFYLEGPPPGVDLLIKSVVISYSSPTELDIHGQIYFNEQGINAQPTVIGDMGMKDKKLTVIGDMGRYISMNKVS